MKNNQTTETEKMTVKLSTRLLNVLAVEKLESNGVNVQCVKGYAWLMAITLPTGQTVAAYPISSLNPLAPPSFYMTDEACDVGIDNRKPPSKIVRHLKKWCSDESLTDAVKELRRCIKLLEP